MPLPTDPLLSQQWHLSNPTAGLLDLNVFGVWNPTEGAAYTGAGTRTVVIDDGFDYLHSDLAPNYDTALDYDFNDADLDPFGTASDAHGTAVTGIIGAAANGTGAVGIAYGTSLVGYRTHGFINDFWLQNIRDAIHHAALSALGDVVNISQGIANDANSEFGVGYNALRFDEIETSIGEAVDQGRGGLGTIIVKSAGNSRGDNYDVNADDWTNDTRQVVVAAVDQNGFVSSYSSYGAAVLVSGFGTPGQVVTTDRTGAAGYDAGDFTTGFNGTSSAAPMVTGVVSLMLDANASLGWRDVQNILAASARQVGSEVGAGIAGSERYAWEWNASSTWNGGGMHFSNDYGYGLVDALAAVRLAESWLLTGTAAARSSNQFTNTMDVLNVSTVIPDGNTTGLSFSGTAGFDDLVDRVTVQMTFSTTFTGDLEVYLTSPDGTVSRMIADTGGANDFSGTWTFESQAFHGERAAGTWTVRVVDDAGSDVLTVSDIVIRTYGAATFDDRYVFTNEYSDYAGVSGHTTTVNDTNGGTDTANAAAVSSSSLIRLDGVVGAIDGVLMTFANVENAIGGDGNDTIYGNSGVNLLFGMRGADQIYAGDANDRLEGATGNDLLDGGDGTDSMYGGDGNDTLSQYFGGPHEIMDGGDGTDTGDWTYSSSSWNIDLAGGSAIIGATVWADLVSIENAIGGSGNDTITGTSGANRLEGGGANDSLDGGSGTDSMYGGDGNDTLSQNFGGPNEIMDGGDGTDTGDWSYNNLGFSWIIDLVAGTAVSTSTTWALLTSIENVIGTQNDDSIIGSGIANRLEGVGGNDTLDGGTGADTMLGGVGNDLYIADSLGDVITENAAEGTDEIRTGLVSYSIFSKANVENLTGTSAAGQTLIGNTLDNVMTAASGADSLNAGGGNDTLDAGGGNDTLEGGSGNDSMIGGAGNDRYIVDSYSDVIVENAAEGTDEIRTGLASYSIFSKVNVENLTGTSGAGQTLTGNSLANILIGNVGSDSLLGGENNDTLMGSGGNDTLDGGSGADRMEGGSGNDRYIVENYSDVVVEAAGSGTDTIETKLGSYSIFSNTEVENLTSISAAGGTLTGNAGANVITGAGGNEVLNGSSGNDTLVGNGGNDTLEGGSGADSMTGGGGNDTYAVDAYGDTVVEGAGGGTDTIVTALSAYSIFSNPEVENLTGTSATGQSLTGNAGTNVITGAGGNDTLNGSSGNDTLLGNGGNDSLEGGAGSDSMTGGGGNDTYAVDAYGDAVIELAGGGTDTIVTTLAAYSIFSKPEVENLTGASAAGHNLTGNTGANVITGAGGNDTLNGGAGADTLVGGSGQDAFVFSTALGGGNIDRMSGFLAADDIVHLENAVFTALGAAGALAGAAFTIGAAATTGAHRIVYDQASGQLFYDADGNGVGVAQLFATVTAGTAMSVADFLVI